MPRRLTWGALKKLAERQSVSDDARIVLYLADCYSEATFAVAESVRVGRGYIGPVSDDDDGASIRAALRIG